jgi:hypothetical protein
MVALAVSASLVGAEYFDLDYGTHVINVDLAMNEDAVYIVPTSAGDLLKVDLTVTDGGSVDFLLTNLTAYMAYRASLGGGGIVDELIYVREHSRQSTGSINYEYTAFVTNTLAIVIDNTAWTVDGAQPTGPVSIEGTIVFEKNIWTWQNIAITALVIGIIIAFMVGVKLPSRKEKE